MKNKKIILGLGTITALGAMSVGFIACVKKKEIENMNLADKAGLNELKTKIGDLENKLKDLSDLTGNQTKAIVAVILEELYQRIDDLSKLTVDKVNEIINKIVEETKNLSKLTKDEINKLIKDALDPKKTAAEALFIDGNNYLNLTKDGSSIRKNKDLLHFNSGTKVKDVIERINQLLRNNNWSVVSDSNRDNIVGTKTGEIIEENGRILNDGAQTLDFKLKESNNKIGDVETEKKLTFNFFVGQKDLSTITDKKIHHNAKTKENIVELLNKKEEFKNIDLSVEDFEILTGADSKVDPTKTIPGKITIKAKDNSKKIKGQVELILETVKAPLNETHIGDLEVTNQTTKKEILDQINKHTDFSGDDKKIDESDFDFEKDDANFDHIGKIKITPKGKTEGKPFTIDISKLIDLKSVITNPALGELVDNNEATIKSKIKEKFAIIKDDGHLEITSITTTTAKVKGKVIYGGEVDVTFTIATKTG